MSAGDLRRALGPLGDGDPVWADVRVEPPGRSEIELPALDLRVESRRASPTRGAGLTISCVVLWSDLRESGVLDQVAEAMGL